MLEKLKNLVNNLKNVLAEKTSGLSSLTSQAVGRVENFSEKSIAIGIRVAKVAVVMFVLSFVVGKIHTKFTPQESKFLNKKLLDTKYTGPSHPVDPNLNTPLIRIVAKNWKGEETSVCSAFVISDQYALTAGHCIVDYDAETLITDTYEIYNVQGELVTTAKAAGAAFRPDLGILRGDFTKFNNTEVVYRGNFTSEVSGNFVSCGFPQGAKHAFCEKFVFQYISGFHYAGSSVLIPGMSGGPTVDVETGKVIGVNVMAYEQPANAQISSLIGFDAAFDIED